MAYHSLYVQTPTWTPLNTSNHPCVLQSTTLGGMLPATQNTPMQLFPSQEPLDYAENINQRMLYRRLYSQSQPNQQAIVLQNMKQKKYVGGSVSSSQRLEQKKSIAVGKTGLQIGTQHNNQNAITPFYSTKSFFPNDVKTTLIRVRNHGSAAPKKKGAIENKFMSNLSAGYGADGIRSTYS